MNPVRLADGFILPGEPLRAAPGPYVRLAEQPPQVEPRIEFDRGRQRR